MPGHTALRGNAVGHVGNDREVVRMIRVRGERMMREERGGGGRRRRMGNGEGRREEQGEGISCFLFEGV